MTPTQRAEIGARRCRHRFRFREVLEANGYTYSDLAGELGVSEVAVSRTIRGSLHSAKVLDWFREKGLPEKYLCDPRPSERAKSA